MSPSTKLVLASKVGSTISANSKGKDVIRGRMQTSDNERSDSIEIDEELSIQFGSIPRDFLVNTTFILITTFKAKERQSPVIKGDVKQNDTPMAEMIDKKDEPEGLSSTKTKLKEFPVECLNKETDSIECSENGSRIIILRPKRAQDRSNKLVRVVLERPSEKLSQHLKPLYIKAHFDGLPVDRILIDRGSAINIMP